MAEKDRINVVPVNNNTLIQTGEQAYLITEGGTLIEITVEGTQTEVLVLGSTGSEILGICGKEELHKAQVNNLTASLTFSPFNPVLSKEVKQVSCGNDHTLILSTDCGVYTYGSNSRGQLGHGGISVDMVSAPQFVTILDGIHIATVAAGGWHSAAISDTGDLYMWGWNETGQLGLPCPNMDKQQQQQQHQHHHHQQQQQQHRLVTQDDKQHENSSDTIQISPDIPLEIHQQIEPVLIQTEPYGLDLQEELMVKKVVCGSQHTCVLFDSGVVMSSGFNAYGQLGLGDTENCDYFKVVPFFVENKLKVVDIHGGAWNMVFVTENDVT